MSIERNEPIRFHEQGTLDAVTKWMATHHDGIAEWFKNVRRQYQVDRANVAAEHRVAVLLLTDARDEKPARIGLLDVGGATLEDVTFWSTWHDPNASRRGSTLEEEQTQGNGGKAYMYRLFRGATRLLGVRERRRNCKGMEGESLSAERGNPGWMPNVAGGRDVEISSFDLELRDALQHYDINASELPDAMQSAIRRRQAFTLVEGQDPLLHKGQIDSERLVANLVRHEQATLCLEQVAFFVMHNGRLLNDGKPLVLPPISPYPGISSPVIEKIPDQLPLDNGEMVSTTDSGTKEQGRLILHTSADDMYTAHKNLRPRWQIIYRTRHQMVGTKTVSEIVGTMPGAHYIYGTVELPSLEPAYVEHGRRRPKPGPLTEALDRFIAEKIKDLARQISARRQEKLDDRALDEVQEENRKLDELKNQFLPFHPEFDDSGDEGDVPTGADDPPPPPPPPQKGTDPDTLEYTIEEGGVQIGKGVCIALKPLLALRIRDIHGRPVPATPAMLEWFTSDRRIATVEPNGTLLGTGKGACEIWVRVKGTDIESVRIPVNVWLVDHVLLTPRTLDVPIGTRQQIVAEVTSDDGQRSTDVLLDWRHDAEDKLLVRISRRGVVTGNRLGQTAVTAGAGDVWARIPVEVNVIPNPEEPKAQRGFPRLLLTDRDLDPASGTVRQGDPDQPPLWQEPSDFVHNVWWLNLQSPQAAFAFRQRASSPTIWRTYHAERLVDMVVQVWMTEDFTRKGESQRPEFWVAHLAAMDRHRVRIVQQMWKRLEPFVTQGEIPQLND